MKIKQEKAAMADVDMTPMIDIVFQLIAFFMVISNFEQQQADARVKLPSDQLARPAKNKRDSELVLNVGFNRDASGIVVGTGEPVVFYTGEKFTIPSFRAQKKLKYESDNYQEKGIDPKEITVIIRADGKVPMGLIQDLIKQAQEANFAKFAFKAKQKSSS